MIDSEHDTLIKDRISEPSIIFQEYDVIVENLKQDLTVCKTEQDNIRSQLDIIQNDSKNTNDAIKEYFSAINKKHCENKITEEKEMIKNLQERLAVLEMEKDSAFQLWQMSLKAVDSLENELKVVRTDGKGTKFYEEQINSIRETYSDAIKTLEEKLLQAKENFIKQQSLYECNKEKVQSLNKEKEDIMIRLTKVEKEALQKETQLEQNINTLKTDLAVAKADLAKSMNMKTELEEKLKEATRFTANVLAKDEETKSKMREALELIESAVKEKEAALQREASALEEKAKLENRVSKITEEYTQLLEKEMMKSKEMHHRNIKKYLIEIKELKTELRQTATLLDRAQRECRLTEDELGKTRQSSEDCLLRSSVKINELEEKLKYTELQLQMSDELHRKKYDTQIKRLEEKIFELRNKLDISTSKIREVHKENVYHQVEDRLKQADNQTREAAERYSTLEKKLLKSLSENENLMTELQSLQNCFDRELQKRDREKYFLEHKIRDFETNFPNVTHSLDGTYHSGFNSDLKKKFSIDTMYDNRHECNNTAFSDQLSKLKERFDKRAKELSQHVTVHQKLSKRWREEAKSLATKFQGKTKDLRSKINVLQKENEELNKELLLCRQQLAQCRVHVIHS